MYNPEVRHKHIEAERERIKTDINRRCYYLKTPIEYYILFPGDVRPTKIIYTPFYGNSDFYLAFTSIHEAMTHKKGSIKPEAIKRNVTETNRIFGGDDTLSNLVWLYSAETKELKAVL